MNMKATTRLLLICVLSALSGPMQETVAAVSSAQFGKSQGSEIPGLSKQEAKDLRERLAASNAALIAIHNDPSAPLGIKEAAVKYVKREPAAGTGGTEPGPAFDT